MKLLMYTWSSLIELKKDLDVFETEDFDLDVRNALKKVRLTSSGMSVVVMGNFDVQEGSINPEFYSTGTWYDFWTGDSLEVTDVNATITLQAGEYRLYTDQKLDTPDFVGVDENIVPGSVSDFELFPNPASGQVNIAMYLKQSTPIRIELYDLQGRKVKSIFNGDLPSGIRTLNTDVAGVEPGIYFIVINAGNQRLTKKVLVEN